MNNDIDVGTSSESEDRSPDKDIEDNENSRKVE